MIEVEQGYAENAFGTTKLRLDPRTFSRTERHRDMLTEVERIIFGASNFVVVFADWLDQSLFFVDIKA